MHTQYHLLLLGHLHILPLALHTDSCPSDKIILRTLGEGHLPLEAARSCKQEQEQAPGHWEPFWVPHSLHPDG